MRNIKLTIEYDGTRYMGWQYQKDFPTIQGEMEKAARRFLKPLTRVKGASRTDSGVHAVAQVANVKCDVDFPLTTIKEAFNFYLPEDIFVKKVEEVPLNFHARFWATSKLYMYRVLHGYSPLLLNRVWMVRNKPDVELIKRAIETFMDVEDFGNYMRIRDENTRIRLKRFFFRTNGDEYIFFIESPKFLYRMVRKIVGGVIEVATGRRTLEELDVLIREGKGKDVRIAPASGLYLYRVYYERNKALM